MEAKTVSYYFIMSQIVLPEQVIRPVTYGGEIMKMMDNITRSCGNTAEPMW